MRTIQRTIFHFLAMTALLASAYPVLCLICYYSGFSLIGFSAMCGTGYVILTGWAALFHAVLVKRRYRKHPVITNLQFLLVGAAFGGMAWLLSPLDGIFAGAAVLLLTMVIYLAAARAFFLEYDQLTHSYVYLLVCIIFIFSSVGIWLSDRSLSLLPQILLLLAITAVFAAAWNFGGIDLALQSQHTDAEHLPKGLFRYNRWLLGIIGGVIVLLVLFREAIGSFLWQLVRAIGYGIGKGIFWLLSLFPASEDTEELPEPEEPAILQETALQNNEWLALICKVLLLGFVIYLLIRNRYAVMDGLRRLLYRLRNAVGRLFHRSYDVPERLADEGYTDYLFDLTASESAVSRSPKAQRQRFSYEKALRNYRRMSPDARKYETGFGLLLYRLHIHGTNITATDSIGTIQRCLAAQGKLTPDIQQAAMIYEQVAYGSESPDEAAFQLLEKLLR